MSAARSLPDLSALVAAMPLEFLLCDQAAFGLTTASPLQRAITRIADGRKLGALAHDPAVIDALGGPMAIAELACMTTRPREVAILSGIRVGKSLIAAALAVAWALTCDVSKLGPGEVPRVSIVSLTKDLAAHARMVAACEAAWAAEWGQPRNPEPPSTSRRRKR